MLSELPMKSQKPSNHCQPPPKIPPLAAALSEVIPDSEEEPRLRPNTKRALLEAELKRRKEFAQILFTDLNQLVFKQGLPANTQLNWNKRLLTTAGRAKFHRSREGIQTTEIELAEKILDCDERIRNTLSHEMCHLATWVIDKKVDEHHGRLFKSWASLIMKKRPDIHVSVKHDYEISYPFEWKCEKCAKIYGRFSKSIRPDECVCGACKEGTLIPLFTTRTPSKKAIKFSRMGAAKPQGNQLLSEIH
ncbi:SprT-like family-domain-containing protein [Gymnopilus junonius]|uniref:SprT-like family-domain-containing protein n=1 Tax=Gymnopilus junonius TaxID=109634 RepID=A0A9P5NYE9_GYMJU|nr:SprT-like family-domain-containing protein [Gymnopilus junonius]